MVYEMYSTTDEWKGVETYWLKFIWVFVDYTKSRCENTFRRIVSNEFSDKNEILNFCPKQGLIRIKAIPIFWYNFKFEKYQESDTFGEDWKICSEQWTVSIKKHFMFHVYEGNVGNWRNELIKATLRMVLHLMWGVGYCSQNILQTFMYHWLKITLTCIINKFATVWYVQGLKLRVIFFKASQLYTVVVLHLYNQL